MEGVPEDMWSPFKQLYASLKMAINDPTGGSVANFEICLKRRKSSFINFLRNPPMNDKNRAQLLKNYKDGATVDGRQMPISKDLIDESIILSDMFDLDEFHALELLCTAQRQMAQHSGLPRGLVAIVLYYDGRKAISCTLRELFKNTAGISWSPEVPKELVDTVTTFTQKLVDESNILGRLIELLEGQLNIDKEFELLTKNRAFGPKKHQNQVRILFEDIRLAIATSLFNWSAQRGLPKQIVLRLLQYLTKYKTKPPPPPSSSSSSNTSNISSGAIDNVGMTLLMALVYAVDTSILQRVEDNNIYVKRLPILSEADFANEIYEKLIATIPISNEQKQVQMYRFECFAIFCFGLSLANLRHAPPNLQIGVRTIIEQDKKLVDNSIVLGVFDYIYYNLMENELLFLNEFFYRRLHLAITDFIDYMYPKVHELRQCVYNPMDLNGESFTKQQLEQSYELLMMCIGKLYKDNPCNLSLCDEYWCSLEANIPTNRNYPNITSRSGALLKFIRMSGKSLTQELFAPFMNMLVGLTSSDTSARKVFNLLKQSQNQIVPIPGTLMVGWDHFFGTIHTYYTNSRMNSTQSFDVNYRKQSNPNHITSPLDIENLQATLSLIGNVAHHDEISRIVFAQNENWSAIEMLLGLLRCSVVPITLKAEIVSTLTAMAKSVESAALIWTSLEASQLIKTVPSMSITNMYDDSDFQFDIDKYESRNEKYPLCRSILEFLYTLVETHVPVNLGIGPRKPGLDPYMEFLVKDIFLKFYSRAYKKEIEKWQIGAGCLKIIHHVLESYEPQSQDFIKEQNTNSPPGYNLMLQLNIKSDLLRLILILLEDVCRILDDYSSFNGKEHVENCALYALLIFEQTLLKQADFYDAHAKAKSSWKLVGIDQLLMAMNQRTRQRDHLLHVLKFVTFNSWLPRHALASIKIIYIAVEFSEVSEHILYICAGIANKSLKLDIRQGFVECLDAIDTKISAYMNTSMLISENGKIIERTIPIEVQIKEAILKLLLRCIKQPMPNFGYFLLGYEIHREVNSSYQTPRIVIETGINCMMSLIVKLEKYLNTHKNGISALSSSSSSPSSDDIDDYIAERCWNLLYTLCVSSRTSETTLHYLRNGCNDILLRYLVALPPTPLPSISTSSSASTQSQSRSPHRLAKKQEPPAKCSVHLLKLMSHVMKCVTIELKLSVESNQTNRFNKICELLVGSIDSPSSSQASSNLRLEYVNYLLQMQTNGNLHSSPPSLLLENRHEAIPNMPLCVLLECISLESQVKSLPSLEYFIKIPEILSSCKEQNLYNIKSLSNVLHNQLNNVQNTVASGQRQYVTYEIHLILKHAVELNYGLTQSEATFNLVEAWCQLTQVLFTCVPNTAMPLRMRKKYIVDIVEQLLMKLVPKKIRFEIALLGSETIVLLITNLRYCCYKMEDDNLENETEMMTSDVQSSTDFCVVAKYPTRLNGLATEHLRFILKNVINWIIQSADDGSIAPQKLRINLYTVFVYILRIIKRKTNDGTDYEDGIFSLLDRSKTDANYFSEFDEQINAGISMVIEVLNSFNHKLIDILCFDVVNGQDVCCITAFTCLDLILEINPVPNVVNFIARRGYLERIITSLRTSNAALCNVLKEIPENLKHLFIYESKMGFLRRYASSHIGAETLLTERYLVVLADMKVFDMHPDMKKKLNVPKNDDDNYNSNNNFIPDVDERFRSILMPALGTIDCILTTLGTQNHLARTQIISFLFSHCDMIEWLLRTATPYKSLGILKELSSVTCIIARTATRDIEHQEDKFLQDYSKNEVILVKPNDTSDNRGLPTFAKNVQNRLGRIQHLMLSLYERFIINKNTFDKMLNTADVTSNSSEDNKNLHIKYFLHTATNIAMYARNVITCRSGTSKFSLLNHHVQLLNGMTTAPNKLTAITNMILSQLHGSVDFYIKEKTVLESILQERLTLSKNLADAQVKIRCQELMQTYNYKQEMQTLAILIVEQNLYLLWIHLDFYLRRAVILNMEGGTVFNDNNSGGGVGNHTSIIASSQEIPGLKVTLLSNFNEKFCKDILAVSDTVAVGKSFTEALLRRIKTLIQFVAVPPSTC